MQLCIVATRLPTPFPISVQLKSFPGKAQIFFLAPTLTSADSLLSVLLLPSFTENCRISEYIYLGYQWYSLFGNTVDSCVFIVFGFKVLMESYLQYLFVITV